MITCRTIGLAILAAGALSLGRASALTPDEVAKAPARVVLSEGRADMIRVERIWAGPVCHSRLVNAGTAPVRVGEVVLFDVPHALAPETGLYGEGFTMLSQTDGTLGRPHDQGYTDRKHYRIPPPADATTLYGLLTLAPPGGGHVLLAFAPCRRFVGRFYVRPKSVQVVLDGEGRTLAPGQAWDLEEFTAAAGPDRSALLAALADRLAENHPPIRPAAVPA
jgi:alpha-galactosidase